MWLRFQISPMSQSIRSALATLLLSQASAVKTQRSGWIGIHDYVDFHICYAGKRGTDNLILQAAKAEG